MIEVECTTTAEAEKAIADGNVPVLVGNVCLSVSASLKIVTKSGKPHIVAWGSSQPHVVAWESSQPHVEARESSQPHVVAWESSQPHVEARESSQPHVEARESSQPHVVAWGSSQPHVVAWGSSQPHVVARESSQPHVVAWGSSQPHVVAWESSQPHVEARESSQPHVVARESSQPHVVAWGSSQPHVEAKGSVQLHVRGKVSVVAAAAVAILISGGQPKIEGGGFVQRVERSTPQAWCDYYGVEVVGDVALVGKLVRDDYCSARGLEYKPGSTPTAHDWDGGKVECGAGLHFCPVPEMAREFDSQATRYLMCPIRLDESAVHPDGDYPHKIKAKRVCAPLWEVNRRGDPLTERDRELRDAFYAQHQPKPEAPKSRARAKVVTKKRASKKKVARGGRK